MRLLALDTATSTVTVALSDGSAVIAEAEVTDPRGHTEHLAPLIEQVLKRGDTRPADLTDIAVGTGPGPFTGLRVGLSTAQTLAFAVGAAAHGVCSLDAIAQAASAAELEVGAEFVVATDARRKEVYWARYRASEQGAIRLDGPEVARPADLPENVRDLPAAGRGALLYPEAFGPQLGQADVSAAALAAVALRHLASGEQMPLAPRYLRRPDAVVPGAPKSALIPPRGAPSARPQTTQAPHGSSAKQGSSAIQAHPRGLADPGSDQ